MRSRLRCASTSRDLVVLAILVSSVTSLLWVTLTLAPADSFIEIGHHGSDGGLIKEVASKTERRPPNYLLAEGERGSNAVGKSANMAFLLVASPQEENGTRYKGAEKVRTFKETIKIKPNITENGEAVFLPERGGLVDGHSSLKVVPYVKVDVVNCLRILNGDQNEIKKAEEHSHTHPKVKIADDSYVESARDCATFRRERSYISSSLTEEEREFPLAYSIVMYKDVEQTERLLRAIYRPQNYYCIHVDAKVKRKVQDGVRAIARCFDNVMVSSNATKVAWGTFSVLEADLFCMEDLLKMSSKWKYFINLSGQEWPLKTNLQLVRILAAMRGANVISGTKIPAGDTRTKWVYRIYHNTGRLKAPPPDNVTLCKGPVHIAATRAYVQFILHDARGRAFLDWVKDTAIPDETFFPSLNHSPDYGVPGAYRGHPMMGADYPHWGRFKLWVGTSNFRLHQCAGRISRGICVYGIGDLRHFRFDERKELFLNKINLEFHPLLLDCLEEYTFNVTRRELAGLASFSPEYYQRFGLTWNHVPS